VNQGFDGPAHRKPIARTHARAVFTIVAAGGWRIGGATLVLLGEGGATLATFEIGSRPGWRAPPGRSTRTTPGAAR
jgi:hypothetical protein